MVELSSDTASAAAVRRRDLVSVQYLRALASLFVVGWHAMGEVGLRGWNFMQGGIEIFFLISGFVIWTITADRPPSPGAFLTRRLARIVPFYWAITTATVAMGLIAPALLQTLRLDPAHILASYAFLPWPNPTPGVGVRPLVIPGWTLNYEMIFYLAFAAALFLPKRLRGPVLAAGLIAVPLLGPWIGGTSPIAAFYTAPLLAEIGIGVLLALVVARRGLSPTFAWLLLLGGAALGVFGGQLWDGVSAARLILLCAPAAMVLVGAVTLDRAGRVPLWRLPKALGDASYALYMVHPLMLSAMVQVWRRTPAHLLPGWSFVLLSLVATSAAGLVVHVLIEKPLTEALQRRLKLSRAGAPIFNRHPKAHPAMVKNPSEVV
jgi:exopolysaccharide production protein ExoZ